MGSGTADSSVYIVESRFRECFFPPPKYPVRITILMLCGKAVLCDGTAEKAKRKLVSLFRPSHTRFQPRKICSIHTVSSRLSRLRLTPKSNFFFSLTSQSPDFQHTHSILPPSPPPRVYADDPECLFRSAGT